MRLRFTTKIEEQSKRCKHSEKDGSVRSGEEELNNWHFDSDKDVIAARHLGPGH